MTMLSEMIRQQNERAAAKPRETQQQPTGQAVPWDEVIARTSEPTEPKVEPLKMHPAWEAYFKRQDTAKK